MVNGRVGSAARCTVDSASSGGASVGSAAAGAGILLGGRPGAALDLVIMAPGSRLLPAGMRACREFPSLEAPARLRGTTPDRHKLPKSWLSSKATLAEASPWGVGWVERLRNPSARCVDALMRSASWVRAGP